MPCRLDPRVNNRIADKNCSNVPNADMACQLAVFAAMVRRAQCEPSYRLSCGCIDRRDLQSADSAAIGAQWLYQGESLGYRTLYLWIADQDLMITVQTNSQPPEGTDKLGEAVNTLYEIVRKPKAK